jgi:large subunit ribosomal protein L15
MNVGELDQMAATLPAEKGKYCIDLEALGYGKLLGTGRVTKSLIVKVVSRSKSAFQKIKDAGGEILAATEKKGE